MRENCTKDGQLVIHIESRLEVKVSLQTRSILKWSIDLLTTLFKQGEISTVTSSHNTHSSGWTVVTWCDALLDPYDPTCLVRCIWRFSTTSNWNWHGLIPIPLGSKWTTLQTSNISILTGFFKPVKIKETKSFTFTNLTNCCKLETHCNTAEIMVEIVENGFTIKPIFTIHSWTWSQVESLAGVNVLT